MNRVFPVLLCAIAVLSFAFVGVGARALHQDAMQDQKDPKVAYDAYVGEYQVQPGFTLTMTNEGGKLMGKPTGDEKAEFKPDGAPDQFFSPVVNARLKFVRDEAGAVTGVIVTLDGKDFPSKKIK